MSDSQKKPQVQLLGYVKIYGEIEAVTGLHIGGTADAIDKGGIDHPVIKNPATNEPYIPGSSLRGRMRSMLEKKGGRQLSEMASGIWMEIYKDDDKGDSPDGSKMKARDSKVCRVFGNAHTGLPSILLVRDALYTTETRRDYFESKLPITEAKIEIAVDRITAQALPRTIERVPTGARFNFSMVYRVQQDANRPDAIANIEDDLMNILEALEEIEAFDGLGGNTARGSGQVLFDMKPLQGVRYSGGQQLQEDLPKRPDNKSDEKKYYSLKDLKKEVKKIADLYRETPSESLNT